MASGLRFPWGWTASLSVSLAIATWALVGDLSEAGGSDPIIEAPTPGGAVIGAVGGAALVAGAASAAGLIVRQRRPGSRPGWVSPVVTASAAGILLGLGARLLTARTGGANIGGGLFTITGAPAILVLYGASVASALRYERQGSSHRR